MFGVGLAEMALIAFIGVIVFGPEKLPELARQAGQMARKARSFAHSARDELRSELGPEYADLELRDLDPRTIVRKHIREALADDPEPATNGTPSNGVSRPSTLPSGSMPPYDSEAT